MAFRQVPGWAKGDGEGEILCLGNGEGEILCPGEKRRVEGRRSVARKNRKRHRRLRRAAQKVRTGAIARSRAGGPVVGMYNVHALAFKVANGIGHAKMIRKAYKDPGCDIIELQEVRRDEPSAFTVAGYVVFCS